MADFLVIATWPFGQTAVKTALPLLQAGKPALDAALAGAQAADPCRGGLTGRRRRKSKRWIFSSRAAGRS